MNTENIPIESLETDCFKRSFVRSGGYVVDYYAQMGLDKTASLDVIGETWRKELMAFATNKLNGLSGVDLSAANDRVQLFNEAYGLLISPRKQEYDTFLKDWTGEVK